MNSRERSDRSGVSRSGAATDLLQTTPTEAVMVSLSHSAAPEPAGSPKRICHTKWNFSRRYFTKNICVCR